MKVLSMAKKRIWGFLISKTFYSLVCFPCFQFVFTLSLSKALPSSVFTGDQVVRGCDQITTLCATV